MTTIARAARVDKITPIISSLERTLEQLDVIGSSIAAAHLDSAIHQLRRDQVRLDDSL